MIILHTKIEKIVKYKNIYNINNKNFSNWIYVFKKKILYNLLIIV